MVAIVKCCALSVVPDGTGFRAEIQFPGLRPGLLSVVPDGTGFRAEIQFPGLRPGLLSVVPDGTGFRAGWERRDRERRDRRRFTQPVWEFARSHMLTGNDWANVPSVTLFRVTLFRHAFSDRLSGAGLKPARAAALSLKPVLQHHTQCWYKLWCGRVQNGNDEKNHG